MPSSAAIDISDETLTTSAAPRLRPMVPSASLTYRSSFNRAKVTCNLHPHDSLPTPQIIAPGTRKTGSLAAAQRRRGGK